MNKKKQIEKQKTIKAKSDKDRSRIYGLNNER